MDCIYRVRQMVIWWQIVIITDNLQNNRKWWNFDFKHDANGSPTENLCFLKIFTFSVSISKILYTSQIQKVINCLLHIFTVSYTKDRFIGYSKLEVIFWVNKRQILFCTPCHTHNSKVIFIQVRSKTTILMR